MSWGIMKEEMGMTSLLHPWVTLHNQRMVIAASIKTMTCSSLLSYLTKMCIIFVLTFYNIAPSVASQIPLYYVRQQGKNRTHLVHW